MENFFSGPKIEDVIGYTFASPDLLKRALSRKAYVFEHGLSDDYHMDALATLGDAVIELAILTRLVQSGGNDKGDLSVRKMDLVNMSVFRKIAEDMNLTNYVHWGNGERRMHIWTSGRVLAECFEALIGAVFLDGELISAERVLDNLSLLPKRDFSISSSSHKIL
jgi:ribonuclease-3